MGYLLLLGIGCMQTLTLASMFRGSSKRGLFGCAGDVGGSGKGSRSDTTTSNEQSRKFSEDPREKELNQLDLELRRSLQPGLLDVNQQSLALSGNLLKGEPLPGYLQGLPGGINPEVTQDIVDRSIEDVRTNLQSSGLLDSGVEAELAARTSADIRTQSEQFNLQNLLQLLNLAVGSSAQVQQPILGAGSLLSNRLSGLRSENLYSKGKTTTTQYGGELHASTK